MNLDAEAVRRLRDDTPGCAERIHLNNAGAGLMPRPVLRAVQEHLELEARIGGYEAADARAEAVAGAYDALAELLGCRPRNVALVENATAAYAQALSAIPFERGDVVLTSEDDYISNQLMFLSLAGRLGVRVVRAPSLPEGGVDPDEMARLMDRDRPRLVALTHVPTNSGLVQPVEQVGAACRGRDLLYLVDACQSVGQLELDVVRLGCDFLAASSRKFLRGPRGQGFLVVSDRALRAGLTPLYVDMRGARWLEADTYRPVETAARFENWEFAYALVLGTGAAARYALEVGLPVIARRASGLAESLRAGLADAGLRVLDRGTRRCAIVTTHLPGVEPDVLRAALAAQRINASVSLREYAVIDYDRKGVPWALRLSPHYTNTEQELGAVVSALATLGA